MADDCLFCRIVRQEIPATLVYSSDGLRRLSRHQSAGADAHPGRSARARPLAQRSEPTPRLLGRLSLAAARSRKTEGIAESGYRTVINTNRDAGQTVFHIHLHLLGGRSMAWPPG